MNREMRKIMAMLLLIPFLCGMPATIVFAQNGRLEAAVYRVKKIKKVSRDIVMVYVEHGDSMVKIMSFRDLRPTTYKWIGYVRLKKGDYFKTSLVPALRDAHMNYTDREVHDIMFSFDIPYKEVNVRDLVDVYFTKNIRSKFIRRSILVPKPKKR